MNVRSDEKQILEDAADHTAGRLSQRATRQGVMSQGKGEEPRVNGDFRSLAREGANSDKSANSPVETAPSKQPYSAFSTNEKWFITAVSAFAALFSPLTANIYFPAIPTIANAFGKSVELINLTVTVYMVVQGVSPMFWGTLSDRWGRRPMYIACMVVLCLSCIGLALVPTNAYWLLMVLRCVQAAGSASTIALGAGVIVDIAAPSERGGFFGFWNIGPMIGPCIGPVLGGALAEHLGWRSIFWFLCIASGVCAIVMTLLIPETLRNMVGNGSIQPGKLYRPLIPIIDRTSEDADPSHRPPLKGFSNPLRLFLYPDVSILLFYNSIIYSVMYAVTTTISSLFQTTYPFLSETDVGLCFLAIGGGMLIGGVVNGELLDYEYQRAKRQMIRKQEREPDAEKRIRAEDVTTEEHFPIERARLRMLPVFTAVFVAACIGYGWCLDKKVTIAGPLILQFFIGWASMAIMNTVQTLLVDLAPGNGSAITACNNLIRCSFGAALVSIIDLILSALGTGWTYTLLSGICVLCSPLIFVILHYGPKWRARRRARQQAS